MINNLHEYFRPEQEIFLETVSYKKIETSAECLKRGSVLLCQDNVKVLASETGVRVVVTRSLIFDPEILFTLSVSFGTDLKFNDRKAEHDWKNVNLAEEFRENGDFVTGQLLSRISLIIGQITSSYGQQPLILPTGLAKKVEPEN